MSAQNLYTVGLYLALLFFFFPLVYYILNYECVLLYNVEYGSEGIVSTRGDVYSYGILLMECFTRKKPTDEMFVEEMSLKRWVEESLALSIVEIIDSKLLGDERYDDAVTMDCVSSLMELALDCCAESPEERINTRNIPIALNKIKSKFL